MAKAKTKGTAIKEPGSPFSVAKTKGRSSKLDHEPPRGADTKTSIDEIVRIKAAMKGLEGELAPYNEIVLNEAKETFSERMFNGHRGNFRMQGVESSISFIAQNVGKKFSEFDKQEIAAKYSKKVADELIKLDYGSIRINADFYLLNQDKVDAVLLKHFGEAFLQNLFTPATFKVSEDVIETAPKHVTSAEALAELYEDLEVRAFLKA